MLYTSYYDAVDFCDDRHFVSISGDRGKSVNFTGEYCRDLAPKLSFWRTWHDNIGKIPEIENDKFYVREYWNQVLKPLSYPKEFEKFLDYGHSDSIMLCYEKPSEFCHRHIVSAWYNILTEEKVPEICRKPNGKYATVDTEVHLWIKGYLEELIYLDRVGS